MSCQQCGACCHGDLCAMCEQISLNEKLHGSAVNEGDEDE